MEQELTMAQQLRKRGIACAGRRSAWLFFLFAWVPPLVNGSVENVGTIISMSLLNLAIIAYVTLNWIRAKNGGPLRGIEKFCQQSDDPEAMMKRLEQIWNEGFATESNFGADLEYMIMVKNMNAWVFPLKDVLWVRNYYAYFATSRGFIIASANGKLTNVLVRFSDAYDMEDYLRWNCPGIILGENQIARELWGKKDIAALQAYIQRRREGRDL